MLGMLIGTLLFVNQQMERLTRMRTSDTAVWDSLQTLLRQKDENTRQMVSLMGRTADSLLLEADLSRIMERQDTVVTHRQVKTQVVTRHDTIRTPIRERKGFFKRLGEVFAPPKEDTTVQVQVTTEVSTDTLTTLENTNVVDSLEKLLLDAARQRHELANRDRRRQRYWGRMDRQLSVRMDSLLKGQEQQVLAQAREQMYTDRKERLRAARIVGGIAVAGITLVAVCLLLIGRDISRSNRYRRQVEEAHARAEQLLKERERLMLAITHDFKAPLGTIKGYVDLLDRLTIDARQRFYLQAMNTAAEHLLRLVTDLLELHRLERGTLEAERVAFCPARLIEEVADAFRPQAFEKGLNIETDVERQLEGRFVGAPMRFRQLLTNLTGNAVKFTERGSVTLTARYDEGRRRVEVNVEDTGPGMTPDEQKRIWEEFTRLPGAQGQEGCGLGLSIVRRLAELLEGDVTVSSQPGQGSVFTVCLPLYPVAETARTDVPSATPHTRPSREEGRKERKLLLVDDDALQLRLTQDMLRLEGGMEAVACLQVDDVWEALRTERFDALLTDIQMPAISGPDLLRCLRASNIPQARTLPVIAVTARVDTTREEMTARGFAGLLHKPFGLKELTTELDRATNRADATDEHAGGNSRNFEALTAYSADDPLAARSILQSFVEETKCNAERLQRAADSRDGKETAAVAHKMVPLFTLIGDGHTADLLRRLERLAQSDFTEEVSGWAEEALRGIEEAIGEGEKRIASHSASI